VRRQSSIARLDPKSYSDRVAADRRYAQRSPLRHHTRTRTRAHAAVSQLRRRRGDTRRYKFYFTICRVRSETDRNGLARSRALTSDSS